MISKLTVRVGVWLALAVPAAVTAVTLERAPEEIGKLEQRYEEVARELAALQKELPRVTAEGVSLKERDEYIERVFKLRGQLADIEARRQELLDSIAQLPKAPPLLKLVAIESASLNDEGEVRGASIRLETLTEIEVGNDDIGLVRTLYNFRLLGAPLVIDPTKPFSVAAEVVARAYFPDDHRCFFLRDERKGVRVSISTTEISASRVSGVPLTSYCDGGGVVKHEWPLTTDKIWYTKSATTIGSKVQLKVEFRPIRKRVTGSVQQYFYTASANGEISVNEQHPFFSFGLPTDHEGYLLPTVDTRDAFGARGSRGVSIRVALPLGGSLTLLYEPVRRSDPVLKGLSIPDHPSEFFEPLVEGSVRSVHIVPDLEGMASADAKKRLESMGLKARLMAGTPARTDDGAGTVEAQDPEPGADVRRGHSIALRIRSGFIDVRTIPDVRGQTSSQAKRILQAAGFDTVSLQAGSAAKTPDETGTIEDQLPGGESKASVTDEVVLLVHAPYVDIRTVPRLRGLSSTEARSRLAEAGLSAVFETGPEADPGEVPGTVIGQDPPADTKVAAQSGVRVTVLAEPVLTTVPDLRGRGYADAKQQLDNLGLYVEQRDAGRARSSNEAHRIQRHDPAPFSQVRSGKTVIVYVSGAYQPTPEEQVAALNCSGQPNTSPGWDQRNNRAACFCRGGYVVNRGGAGCVASRDTLIANYNCSMYTNSHAAWDETRNGPACFCNAGFGWNGNQSACVRQGGGTVAAEDPLCESYRSTLRNMSPSHPSYNLTRLVYSRMNCKGTDPTGDGGGGFDDDALSCPCTNPATGRRYRPGFGQTECPAPDSTLADYESCN